VCSSDLGLGQTTAIGIGGDPIIGTTMRDCLELFQKDPDTDGVVIIGEIGGQMELEAAYWAKENMSKPITGFIAGKTAPPGKRMGHAGAIVSGGNDTAEAKIKVLNDCGISVSESVADIGSVMSSLMN
jgi:succinyl-CoA synthetase alpha subunit